MIILGVNGSPFGGHDASACIVKDGEISVAAEEERFTRSKHAYDVYPHAAIEYCLDHLGISLGQVDRVAFGWDLPRSVGPSWQQIGPTFLEGLFPLNLFGCKKLPDCTFIPHHLAHAASAFWCSGFSTSSILVMDGQGESASGILAFGDRSKGIKILEEFPVESSLGYLYKAASGFAGLGRENPGKLMGLSSYGRGLHTFPLLRMGNNSYTFNGIPAPGKESVEEFDNMEPIIEWWMDYFSKQSGLPAARTNKHFNFLAGEWLHSIEGDISRYADFAASIQLLVEKVGCHLVRDLVRHTGCRNLSLSGGVTLNCSMNGTIARMPEIDDLFVFPAAHDSGTSVGAALKLCHDLSCTPPQRRLTSCYLGPAFSDREISEFLDRVKAPYEYMDDEALHRQIARLLCQENIVAVFAGRSEIGPRALGNRSILAAPNSTSLRDRVNRAKGRELWRPLCPSILAPFADDFFIGASKGSPFMLRSLVAKESGKGALQGVIHVDGTARVQVVNPASGFGKIIEAYRQQSGVPAVLNTSFNLAGEPIVGSPSDALRSFYSSSIDVLVLGNYLILKG